MLLSSTIFAGEKEEHSIARKWIDTLLEMVKVDGFGPTIEARNIYHMTIAMYDGWAIFDDKAETVLLGKTLGGYTCEFIPEEFIYEGNVDSIRALVINYAALRVINFRYNEYSSKGRTIMHLDSLIKEFNLDLSNTSIDFSTGSAVALGNYIGQCVLEYGFQDGAGDEDLYESKKYEPVNQPLRPDLPGNPNILNPNRWQPISVNEYIDEKGWDVTLKDWNVLLIADSEDFLSPEWGNVIPFALTEKDKKVLYRDGVECNVYCDPGPPPMLTNTRFKKDVENYKWGFVLNAVWGGLLDPKDSVMVDISPGALGNTKSLPSLYNAYPKYYDLMNGGVKSKGHKVNPYTNQPYKPNFVYRGDYARVIAEYWIDGVNTYSPPGHWLKNLGKVSYNKDFKRKWMGEGEELSQLEWDIKAYLVMTGAMHDAAIAGFSIKGYYDYVRPISAIRYMADKGQSGNPKLPRYHPHGIPLVEGHIELIGKKDPLVGENRENFNKIKIYSWKGPDSIVNVRTEMAGTGWILAENWWPYQRYSFITPSFAGYVSGHSTFSTAGASVLELITGSPFFPGGLYEFTANKNEFLEFEEGPSTNVTLQWATYWDAAYETCLSRIWGGIHPPCDDIPGRKIGTYVGKNAVKLANKYFEGKVTKK